MPGQAGASIQAALQSQDSWSPRVRADRWRGSAMARQGQGDHSRSGPVPLPLLMGEEQKKGGGIASPLLWPRPGSRGPMPAHRAPGVRAETSGKRPPGPATARGLAGSTAPAANHSGLPQEETLDRIRPSPSAQAITRPSIEPNSLIRKAPSANQRRSLHHAR